MSHSPYPFNCSINSLGEIHATTCLLVQIHITFILDNIILDYVILDFIILDGVILKLVSLFGITHALGFGDEV